MRRHKDGANGARRIDEPQIPGGAAGIPEKGEDSPRASVEYQPIDGTPQLQAKRFMVIDGPRGGDGKIRYQWDGSICSVPPGKIVTEASHNLNDMRRQGIRLELVPDIVEEDEPTELETAPQGEVA